MRIFSIWNKRNKSGAIAKQRLKRIVISDRIDCSVDLIDAIKGEIGQSLSKYMEVDLQNIKLDIVSNDKKGKHDKETILKICIPFSDINKVIC